MMQRWEERHILDLCSTLKSKIAYKLLSWERDAFLLTGYRSPSSTQVLRVILNYTANLLKLLADFS
jgi:plasmid replication initiation protein